MQLKPKGCAGKLRKAGLFWSGVGALILTVASWACESAFVQPLAGAGGSASACSRQCTLGLGVWCGDGMGAEESAAARAGDGPGYGRGPGTKVVLPSYLDGSTLDSRVACSECAFTGCTN